MTKYKIQNNKKAQILNVQTLVLIFVILILNFFCHLDSDICHLSYAQEPSKEEESLYVAKKALEDGFYDVSLGLAERFLKNYPNSSKVTEVNLLIGRCYFYQNRFLDALSKFQGLLDNPEAKNIMDAVLYWTAEVHFKGNNFDKAIDYYKRVINEYPKSTYLAAAYYSLGWSYLEEQKFSDALKYFEIVEDKYSKEPQGKDAPFKIIECLYNLKDYSGLKERLKVYLKKYANNPAQLSYIYFYMAEADYYQNNFDNAIEEYVKVIQNSNDEKMQALSRLGIAWSYLKLKKYKDAEDNFLEVKAENLEKRNIDVFLLGKAILMAETNRVNEASKIYDELIKTTEDVLVLIQAYLGKADSLYNLSEYADAINIYKIALSKATPEYAQGELVDKLHYNLAWAFLKQGEFKQAIAEFQKIVKETADKIVKISALCQIGDAYQDSGDIAGAQETYDAILKNYPDSFYSDYVQYQLGLTLLKVSNYDGAIMSFSSIRRNFPLSKLLDDATYALGLAYFQKQDYNSSKEIFTKFQEEFKDSNLKPQAVYLLGTSLFNLGNFSEAIEVFKEITRAFSQDKELTQKAEYEIADCYYQMGNEKEAMERFNVLRSKYPDSTLSDEVMWWLGGYYYRQNQLDLARRYFSSLIRDFPKSNLVADAYYVLGSSFEEESRHDEAIENFSQVIELGRTDLSGQAAIAIADIYAKQGKLDFAHKAYNDIISNYPNLTNVVYPKMADLFYRSGNYSQAISYYRKSLNMVPVKEMAAIQLKIAEALEAQGSLADAIEEYLKVTYLYSEKNNLSVKALLRVAQIYERKENFKEAKNIYKRITSMDVQEAKYAQERIEWINKNIK